MRTTVFCKVMPCIIADHMDVSLKMEAAGSFETPGLISPSRRQPFLSLPLLELRGMSVRTSVGPSTYPPIYLPTYLPTSARFS